MNERSPRKRIAYDRSPALIFHFYQRSNLKRIRGQQNMKRIYRTTQTFHIKRSLSEHSLPPVTVDIHSLNEFTKWQVGVFFIQVLFNESVRPFEALKNQTIFVARLILTLHVYGFRWQK